MPSGVRLPIRYEIRNAKTGTVVISEEKNTFGSRGCAWDYVERPIGGIKIKPGKYISKVEVLENVPEFVDLKATVSLTHNPMRHPTTLYRWIVAIFLGEPLNTAFLFLICTIITLLLLVRGVKAYLVNKKDNLLLKKESID